MGPCITDPIPSKPLCLCKLAMMKGTVWLCICCGQGIWIGTPWSAPLQNSRSFWNAGLRLHSTKMSAECRVKWSVTRHSKGLHSSPWIAQADDTTCSPQSRISTDMHVYFHSKRLGFQFIFSFYSNIEPCFKWRVD